MKIISSTIVCLLLTLVQVLAQNWSPDQLLKLKNITSVQVSPKGDKILYTLREAIMTEDRSEYINQIWIASAEGGAATAEQGTGCGA